jgi:hypothetical protein
VAALLGEDGIVDGGGNAEPAAIRPEVPVEIVE